MINLRDFLNKKGLLSLALEKEFEDFHFNKTKVFNVSDFNTLVVAEWTPEIPSTMLKMLAKDLFVRTKHQDPLHPFEIYLIATPTPAENAILIDLQVRNAYTEPLAYLSPPSTPNTPLPAADFQANFYIPWTFMPRKSFKLKDLNTLWTSGVIMSELKNFLSRPKRCAVDQS